MFKAKLNPVPQPQGDGLVSLISGLSSLLGGMKGVKTASEDKLELKDDDDGQLLGSFMAMIAGKQQPIKSINKSGGIQSFIKPG